MLNRSGNDVLALRARFEGGMKRGVVRFRSTTGKHDFARFAAKKCGDLFPRLLDGIAHLRREPITARWVGEIFLQKRPHRLQYRRIDCRRRVVIEVSDLVRRDHGTGINGIPVMPRCKPSPYPAVVGRGNFTGLVVRHPLGKLSYAFDKKNSEKIKSWLGSTAVTTA